MSDSYENIEFTYDSYKRKHPAIEELVDVIKYRDMIFQFVRRDIVSRYKRSVLGVAWTMLQPLGMMVILTVVFSQLFRHIEGYASYLLSGLISWTFFSQATTAALQEVLHGGSLSRKIYVPYTAFAISSTLTGMVNLVIAVIPLAFITIALGIPLTWAFLFTPITIIIISMFTLGVGLILSTFSVQFPDIREMYQIILQAWLYFTPIFYPKDILPESYQVWILKFNPMYYMISLFREPIYNGILPSTSDVIISTSISVVTLIIGWTYFAKQSDKFAYNL